jgi:hypothetical protein
MSQLTNILSQYWASIQGSLFPWLREEFDPLTQKQQQLIEILEIVRIEEFLPDRFGHEGRPQKTRCAIVRSFIAKMVYNIETTTFLIERLKSDRNLRRICGWERVNQLPSESTFSRAFSEFADSLIAKRAHDGLIRKTLGTAIIQHKSTDSTAIEARERPQTKKDPKTEKTSKRKKKRRKKPTRIEVQTSMTIAELLANLPTGCDRGAKRDSKGNVMYWTGYKLHIDTVDGDIPVSAIVTSASVHDSQVAIPLCALSARKITNCYDLMDSAYDVPAIAAYSLRLNHIPLIDRNPRGDKELGEALSQEQLARKKLCWAPAEEVRYNERSAAERVNSRLKDEFGAKKVRVRGNDKVACHLMFGILVLAADQLMKLVT